jgi:hypothetical protein
MPPSPRYSFFFWRKANDTFPWTTRQASGAGRLGHCPGSGRWAGPHSPGGGRRNATVAAVALALAPAVSGCNPLGYPDCFRVQCPYPPVYNASYAGYAPAYVPGRPAFGEPPFDDPLADYTQRTFAINTTVGNAQAANQALQTETPWPRYSSNTSIPLSGPRAVGAVHSYYSGGSPPFGPALPPPINGASSIFGSTGGGGGSTSSAPTAGY